RGRTFSGYGVHLVVAIQVVLVRPVAELYALKQLISDVGVAGSGEESGEPIETGEDAVLNGVCGNVARPAQHARHAEATLHDRPFALCERRGATIGPGEEFGAVVRG